MTKKKKVASKRGRGRPSSFRPEFVEQAKKLAQQFGATDAEIADFLGKDLATFYRWRHTHPDFCEAVKTGKDIADERLERRLYERAFGFSQPAVKIFMPAGAKKPVIVPYIERFPPSETALIFWLSNRRRDQWRRDGGAEGGIDVGEVARAIKTALDQIEAVTAPPQPS